MICLSRTEIYDINSEKEVTGLIINFVVTRSNRSINYLGITVFDHVTNQVNFLSLLFYFLNFAYVIIFHILLALMKGVFKNALANYSVRKKIFFTGFEFAINEDTPQDTTSQDGDLVYLLNCLNQSIWLYIALAQWFKYRACETQS